MPTIDESSDQAEPKTPTTLAPTVFRANMLRSMTPSPPRSQKLVQSRYTEQFPVLSPLPYFPPSKDTKSQSLTDAEIKGLMMNPAEVEKLAENLKNSEPPMSLDQARKRRATIKEDRKASIDFIKLRTARRVSRAAGIPSLEITGTEGKTQPFVFPGPVGSGALIHVTGTEGRTQPFTFPDAAGDGYSVDVAGTSGRARTSTLPTATSHASSVQPAGFGADWRPITIPGIGVNFHSDGVTGNGGGSQTFTAPGAAGNVTLGRVTGNRGRTRRSTSPGAAQVTGLVGQSRSVNFPGAGAVFPSSVAPKSSRPRAAPLESLEEVRASLAKLEKEELMKKEWRRT